MRIKSTYEELYNIPKIEMQDEDIKNDIEYLKMLYSICKEKELVTDTVVLLN